MPSARALILPIAACVLLGAAWLAGETGKSGKTPLESGPGGENATTVEVIARMFPRTEEHDFDPPKPGSYRLSAIKPAADGDVLGIGGGEMRLAALMTGKITVLSFIYTLCSDAKGCPLAMATLFDAYHASKQLPEIAGNARFITLSFDPGRDTPEAMKSFAYPVLADSDAAQKIPWDFLTTKSEAQLGPILKAYGQVIDPSADGETISHLLRLYLIDRSGQIRNIYGLGFLDPRLLFTDIKTLLLEEQARGAGAS